MSVSGVKLKLRRERPKQRRQPTTPERLAELRTMPYRQYLRSWEWQRKRRVALKLAGYQCRMCGETSRLQVHHKTYERRGCEKMNDLVVLCDGCHRLVHRFS